MLPTEEDLHAETELQGTMLDLGSIDIGDLDLSALDRVCAHWARHAATAPAQTAARIADAQVVVSLLGDGFQQPMRELAGRRLGIVGYGELGRGVARAAQAFGMEVLVARRPGSLGEAPSAAVPRVSLAELLSCVDVLSLHCPLTDATRNLIVTPHAAWACREARQRLLDEVAANIAAFATGERRNRVA
jgi:phosphoglycerate dehydrogenase-like enzyme